MPRERTLLDFLSEYKFRVKGYVESEHYKIVGAETFFASWRIRIRA